MKGLLLGVVAVLAASAVQAQPIENVDLARQRFQRGRTLYDEGSHEAALVEFQASVALYASPNSHLYAARCLRALGRFADAVVEYERSLGLARDRAATDPRYVETGEAAQAELATVAPKVGRLRVDAQGLPPGTRVTVGEREIPPGGWGLPLPVNPGQVRVVAAPPGHPPIVREVTVGAGGSATVELGKEPAAGPPPTTVSIARPSGLRPWWWASAATATAGFASFGVFYLLAGSAHRGLEERCNPAPCGPGEDAAIARGRLYQTLTNVALVVGLAGAAGTAGLWLLDDGRGPEGVALRIGLGPGAVSVSGSF